jgi:hypothetical protein
MPERAERIGERGQNHEKTALPEKKLTIEGHASILQPKFDNRLPPHRQVLTTGVAIYEVLLWSCRIGRSVYCRNCSVHVSN